MRTRKWLLVILALVASAAWYYLSYKSFSRQQVAASADMVLVVDVKKNTNKILYYYLTHPSKWSAIFGSKKGNAALLKKALVLPDYLYFFHSKGQPAASFYCLLTIKNESAFAELLTVFNFKEQAKQGGSSVWFADNTGISIVKKDDQLLVGNGGKDSMLMRSVADELFTQKLFISDTLLNKITAPANDFTVYIKKDIFLQQDFLLNGKLANGQLHAEGRATPDSKFEFREDVFNLPESSLMTLAFTQPSTPAYQFISGLFPSNLSLASGVKMDSFFLPGNKKYLIDIAGMKSRVDSAITYSYDDNFNKVEKIVISPLQEPSFNCTVVGEHPSAILNYWKQNKLIEETSSGARFTAIPFVKIYASAANDMLSLTAQNYNYGKSTQPITCIGNICFRGSQLPSNLMAFLPDWLVPFIQQISVVNVVAKKEKAAIKIELSINTKNTTKPFLLSFE